MHGRQRTEKEKSKSWLLSYYTYKFSISITYIKILNQKSFLKDHWDGSREGNSKMLVMWRCRKMGGTTLTGKQGGRLIREKVRGRINYTKDV